MKAFTDLYLRLDGTTKTNAKIAALADYFAAAPPADAAWALYFLTGRKLKRIVNTRQLRQWTAELANQPLWLLEECYDVVGDLAETLALLHPGNDASATGPLHQLVETVLQPLAHETDESKQQTLLTACQTMSAAERFVWNKLITGGFRVGVSQGLVVRALARVAAADHDLSPANAEKSLAPVIAHRLMGDWHPTADHFLSLFSDDADHASPGQPYPFCLAPPIEQPPADLGPVTDWQAEWKWDGIRAQLIKRNDEVLIWSRGEELVTHQFPEVAAAAANLPNGTVLDGELLCWADAAPLSFGLLQKRLGRKRVGAKLQQTAPVAFMAYDLMEAAGTDCRSQPLSQRRRQLGAAITAANHDRLLLSPTITADSWEELAAHREQSRQRGVEGLMLKRRDSAYGVGRKRGAWWKWKIDPYFVDAVLTYAQKGHGRRADLFTDYTFGVWQDGQLVTIAKAYSGLTDKEFREVDRFVRDHTVDRFGPVRQVEPQLVFELAFEGIRASSRHKAGLAFRFPRMHRWRRDKQAADANSLADVRALLPEHQR